MVRNRQATSGMTNRSRLRIAGVMLIALVIFGLGGCYWTGGVEQEAGLVLEITRSRDGSISSQDIVDPYGFLFAYVIEESVLLQGPDAVEDLFERLDAELETVFLELFELFFEEDEATIEQFLADFRFDIEFPSAQFQGQFITFQRGASGRNTFRGLNAGANYLVVVEAFGEDDEAGIDADAIGFALTTVRAGETRAVSLNLDDNYGAFDDFIRDRYGFEVTEESGDLEPGDVIFFASPLADGPFYAEMIDADLYVDDALSPAFLADNITISTEFMEWYTRADVRALNPDGTEVSGQFRTSPVYNFEEERFEIPRVISTKTWRLLITSWGDRDSVPSDLPTYDAALSDPFTIPPGNEVIVDSFTVIVISDPQ